MANKGKGKIVQACPPDILTGKLLLDLAHKNGNMPNAKVMDEALSDEGIYQTSKEWLGLTDLLKGGNQFISDTVDRPTEILKNHKEVVETILDTYDAVFNGFYKENNDKSFMSAIKSAFKWNSKEKQFKNSSKLAFLNEKLDKMNNFERNYFNKWMDFLQSSPSSNDWWSKTVRNVRENYLLNSISGAILNSTQLSQTVIPNSDIQDVGKAIEMFLNDRKNGYKELKEMGIGERAHFEEIGKEQKNKRLINFDVFMMPERYNQGIAYYIGKAEAMRKDSNTSEENAKKAGVKKNEELNFVPRPGNLPRMYWNSGSRSNLTLLTYTLQFNKMYANWIKDTVKGAATGNKEQLKKGAIPLTKHILLTSMLYGVKGAIPAPIWALLSADEDRRDFIEELSKLSVFQAGGYGIDLTTSLQGVNLGVGPIGATVINDLVDGVGNAVIKAFKDLNDDEIDALYEPKFYKNFIKICRTGLIVLPVSRIKGIGQLNIGGGQLGEWVEAIYRIGSQQYERTSFETKKRYEGNWYTELMRATAGRSVEESDLAAGRM